MSAAEQGVVVAVRADTGLFPAARIGSPMAEAGAEPDPRPGLGLGPGLGVEVEGKAEAAAVGRAIIKGAGLVVRVAAVLAPRRATTMTSARL